MPYFENILWLLLEGTLMLVVCLTAFRWRHRIGMGPMYVLVGGLQHMQTNLAATVYADIAPGISVSPGSAVLFVASLFVVLLIYLNDDALEARSLIYGIVFTNLALSAVGVTVYAHTMFGMVTVYSAGYIDLLVSSLRMFIAGTGALIIDVLLIIVIYEFISKHITSIFGRVMTSIGIVVMVDSVIFATAAFLDSPRYFDILVSGIIGKGGMALFYATALSVYMRVTKTQQTHDPYALRDIFAHLTYRQRFDALAKKASRDDLSGLFNRGYFDHALARTLEEHETVSLVFLDLDDFKGVNDTYGHAAGDLAIKTVANTMMRTFRTSDIVCRFGGDEFAAILPDADQATATRACERLRANLIEACDPRDSVFEFGAIKVSIGVSSQPRDGHSASELLLTADRRLYRAKDLGKDQISSLSEASTDEADELFRAEPKPVGTLVPD